MKIAALSLVVVFLFSLMGPFTWSVQYLQSATKTLVLAGHEFEVDNSSMVGISGNYESGNSNRIVEIYPSDDASVWYETPDTNYGSSEWLELSRVGDPQSWGFLRYAFMKFDLSAVPPEASITKATLHIYFKEFRGGSWKDNRVGVCEVAEDEWSEGTITWNNKPSYQDVRDIIYLSNPPTWENWDATSWIQSQHLGDNVASLMLKPPYPDTGYFDTAETKWYSKEKVEYRPYLEVTYVIPQLAIEGLVGYWKFDEGSGDVVYDNSGYGNHGTISGASFVAGALSFDGVDDQVVVPDSPSLDISGIQLTLEAWVRPRSFALGDASDWADAIIAKGDDDMVGHYGLNIGGGTYPYGRDPQFKIRVSLENDDEMLLRLGENYTMDANAWYHVACTYDGSYMRIYVNGELEGQQALNMPIGSNDGDLYFGVHPIFGTPFEYRFDGLIGEIRIYNRALSDEEVLGNYLFGIHAPPSSSVNPIVPYWQTSIPFTITASVTDYADDVASVELWYRYSLDNWTDQVAWKKHDWQRYGVDTSPQPTDSPLEDDFNGTTLDSTKWENALEGTGEASILVENSWLTIEAEPSDGRFWVSSKEWYTYGILEIKARMPAWDNREDEFDWVSFGFDRAMPMIRVMVVGTDSSFYTYDWRESSSSYLDGRFDFSDWHVYKIVWTPGEARLYVDGELVAVHTVGVPRDPDRVMLGVGGYGNGEPSVLQVDYVRVRPAYHAEWQFTPERYGYYEFYSVATDGAGNREEVPRDEAGNIVADSQYRVCRNLARVVVILAEPSDENHSWWHDKAYYQRIAEDTKRYYDEVSYGSLALEFNIYDNNGDWFKLPAPFREYMGTGIFEGMYNDGFFVDAVQAADEQVDYGYYRAGDYVILIVGGGTLRRARAGVTLRIWGEEWVETRTAEGPVTNMASVHEYDNTDVWAHEIAHVLGRILSGRSLPDLYQTSFWFEGGEVDGWGLMGGPTRWPTHLSSWSKERLGWLKYQDFSSLLGYIRSLPNLNYGDKVWRRWTNGWFDDTYFVFEVRSFNTQYSWWDHDVPLNLQHEGGLVLYKWYDPWIGAPTLNVVPNPNTGRNYFLPEEDYWLAPPRHWPIFGHPGVLLSVLENRALADAYEMRISVRESWSWENRIVVELDPFPQWWSGQYSPLVPPPENVNWPDLDLHAYTIDGKHVGINYETGEYEMQILGTIASGEFYNSSEWISVPENIEVYFTVSSHDVATFLENDGGVLDNENGLYALTLSYFDENLGGSGTGLENQRIEPGAEAFHSFKIVRNPDGTYLVEVQDSMNLLSLEAWHAAIDNIPDNLFTKKPAQRKNALKEKFEEVFEKLKEAQEEPEEDEDERDEFVESYRDAIEKLKHDILGKLDVDGKADWMKEPTLVPEINAFTALLMHGLNQKVGR